MRSEPTAPPASLHRRQRRAGYRNASSLYQHVRAAGYSGSLTSVHSYVRDWRTTNLTSTSATSPALASLPPPRALAWRRLQDAPDPNTQALVRLVPDAAHHTARARAGIDVIRNPAPPCG